MARTPPSVATTACRAVSTTARPGPAAAREQPQDAGRALPARGAPLATARGSARTPPAATTAGGTPAGRPPPAPAAPSAPPAARPRPLPASPRTARTAPRRAAPPAGHRGARRRRGARLLLARPARGRHLCVPAVCVCVCVRGCHVGGAVGLHCEGGGRGRACLGRPPWGSARAAAVGRGLPPAAAAPAAAGAGAASSGLLGTVCPPPGALSWVAHDPHEQARREASSLPWPYGPLWRDLLCGVLAFRVVAFPLARRGLARLLDGRPGWAERRAQPSAYGVTVGTEAVWGGAIGLWHALSAAGLALAWAWGSVPLFRSAVALEAAWELDDLLMLVWRTPGRAYGGTHANLYVGASARIRGLMLAHHVLGLLYIPFGCQARARPGHAPHGAEFIGHGAVAARGHGAAPRRRGAPAGVLAAMHGTNLAVLCACRRHLPRACWRTGHLPHGGRRHRPRRRAGARRPPRRDALSTPSCSARPPARGIARRALAPTGGGTEQRWRGAAAQPSPPSAARQGPRAPRRRGRGRSGRRSGTGVRRRRRPGGCRPGGHGASPAS